MTSAVKEFLELQAASSESRIIQACVQDHAGPGWTSPGHLHVMIHFADESNSPWCMLNNVDLMTFRAEVQKLNRSIRIHLHEGKKPAPVAHKEIVDELPRLTLTATTLSLLSSDGASSACSICLQDYEEDDELVCMPCSGLHKAHWGCMASWLGRAATCPTCRFELPTKSVGPGARDRLLDAAKQEVERLRRAEAAPCQAADDEPEEAAVARAPSTSAVWPDSEGPSPYASSKRAPTVAVPAGPAARDASVRRASVPPPVRAQPRAKSASRRATTPARVPAAANRTPPAAPRASRSSSQSPSLPPIVAARSAAVATPAPKRGILHSFRRFANSKRK
mmetsp:Transcript_36350/g.100300  ORF Transcript_36350/g.100300 Transcript_36350/m.100300 type:complete len:336 (-) Transcript_36350:145-1152(-)